MNCQTLAVDLGGTNLRVAIIGDDGTILDERSSRTLRSGQVPENLTDRITGLLRELLESHGHFQPSGIGISAAGPVDFMSGTLTTPPNLPYRDIPLKKLLSETFSVPVHVLNDCHAGIVGETAYGSMKGVRDGVYLTISTGIGAGVSTGGTLMLGRDGNAAEVGHFVVDSTFNIPCPCGYNGHWEGYASGRHIPRFFSQWCRTNGYPEPPDPPSARELFDRARLGDPVYELFLDSLSRINARGLSDIIVAYDPDVIVLDGSVIRFNQDLILAPMLDYTERYLPLPDIRITALEGRAPLIGAGIIGSGLEHSPLRISFPV
jgi:glucokinase